MKYLNTINNGYTLSESIISMIWSLRYFVNISTELKLAFFISVISFSAFTLKIKPITELMSTFTKY